MGKKKIDELFQEKFKNFEQVPDDKVWQAIEASLEKKKKRVIPIWWKLGGVAAVLAIGLLAINPFSDTVEGKPALTEIEEKNQDSLLKQDKIQNTQNATKTQLTNSNSKEDLDTTSGSDDSNTKAQGVRHPKDDLNFSPKTTGEKKEQFTSIPEKKSEKATTVELVPKLKTQVVDTEQKQQEDPKLMPNKMTQLPAEVLVQKYDAKETITDKQKELSVVENQEQDKIKKSKEILLPNSKEVGIAQNDSEQLAVEKNTDSLSPKKKSIYDEIIEQEERALVENSAKNRWAAGPSIAPVYFDAFGEGSPVHSILVPNSKSGKTSLSYGVSIAYEINNRFSVRSGIHKVDYGYDTGEIEFSSSLDGSITNQMDNIDYAGTARNLVVKSKAGSTAVAVNDENTDAFDASFSSTARTGSMSQQFGYLEVPLELNYSVIDKKIGVNIIGGFSSLFLIDNSISLSDGNQSTQVGEANNVNGLNFSTNIGLGVDYNFSPNIKLNIEPVFKYQLNTFNQVDGTFNPFSIGIYSGLTFKF